MVIKKLTFTVAGEQNYTVPENARSIGMQVSGGQVDMRLTTGTDDDQWPITDGTKEEIRGRDLNGLTLYFTGQTGAVLYLRVLTEMGS